MDDDAGSSGALTLAAPAPSRPPEVLRAVVDADHLLHLETVRRRLVADTVALVRWDEQALRVVSLSGVRLSGSTAMATGTACAAVDHLDGGGTTRASAGRLSVYATRLPAGPGTTGPEDPCALVVVEPRTLTDLAPDAVGTAVQEMYSTP